MFRTARPTRILAPLLFLLPFAAGCSSSSSGGGDATAALTVAITDAASDELASFVVEVTSITLSRRGGRPIGVLPGPVTVDLVTLQEASQILNVMNVPPGRYTAATVTFDFTNASAFLVGETTPATILDADGLPLTGPLTLPVQIGNALGITGSRHRILELDFSLDQSVMVDSGANTVSVEPAIVMRVDRTDPKELVTAGELWSVDVSAGTFLMRLRTPAGARITDLTVVTDADTVFQVDGVPFQGAAGLDALALLAFGTWVQVYGAIDPARARLMAEYVEAGTGTHNGGQDVLDGHVTGRVGGAGGNAILTVLGQSVARNRTSRRFHTAFTVSTSFLDTKVLMRGASTAHDTDSINVGQRIRVFGDLNGFTLDATSTSAVVRLQPTHVGGIANGSVAGGVLELDLTRVGLLREGSFAWGEGGTTPPNPDAFQVLVGNLGNGLSIAAGSAVEARGFFTPVDDDQEDLTALSLTNLDRSPSLLFVHDRPGGMSVVATASATGVRIVIAGAPTRGEAAHVTHAPRGPVALPAAPDLMVVPSDPSGLGFYSIRDRVTGLAGSFFTFAEFAAALDGLLGQGALLFHFNAVGQYDLGTNTMSSALVTVALD